MSLFKASMIGAFLLAAGTSAAPAQSTGTSEFLATVRTAGTVVTGSGVSGSAKIGVGRYQVDFPRPINTCSYIATPISAGAFKAVTRTITSNTSRILVNTFINASTPQDVGFTLIVKCQD